MNYHKSLQFNSKLVVNNVRCSYLMNENVMTAVLVILYHCDVLCSTNIIVSFSSLVSVPSRSPLHSDNSNMR